MQQWRPVPVPQTRPELPALPPQTVQYPTTLLTALGFNPHTNSRYPDSGGAEVIVEGEPGPSVSAAAAPFPTAAAAVEAALTVEGSGTVPSAGEAVSGALALLEQLLPERRRRPRSIWSAFRRTESATHADASPISSTACPFILPTAAAAAEIILTGSIISTLSLRPMLYL